MNINFTAFQKLNLTDTRKFRPGEYVIVVGGKFFRKGKNLEQILSEAKKNILMIFLWYQKFPNEQCLFSFMVEFNYQEEYSDQFGKILRPVAPILITYKSQAIFATMYIDSGADVTMIPLRAGKVLGFIYDPKMIFQMHGIAGSMPCILEQAELGIGKKKIRANITWALSDEVPFLLGRRHIFQEFGITFQEVDKKVVFR